MVREKVEKKITELEDKIDEIDKIIKNSATDYINHDNHKTLNNYYSQLNSYLTLLLKISEQESLDREDRTFTDRDYKLEKECLQQ